ncbi:Elongator subunit elp4 [Mycoemilia scoparia]|uniref:Elongator complex protein 4 n=1 Tax=Mycoemilia scoparia TaxID=417184 RepID=A0A9W8DRY8_9FUNG|nr:Elongator subunit elp4 [Mycoemilia scoparia]
MSPHKAQVLTSTGIPSLDDVLGGGLPVGSILLVKEDRQSEYSRTVLSYFLSQGIASEHKILVASADGEPETSLLSKLPCWAKDDDNKEKNNTKKVEGGNSQGANDLKIAWRYKNLPNAESYSSEMLQRQTNKGGLLRYSFAVCVITIPAHLYQEHSAGSSVNGASPLIRRIEHICDAVVGLESFEGQYVSPKDTAIALPKLKQAATATSYHGFFKIHKLPCLNTLVSPASRLSVLVAGGGGGRSANDLAFCLRRKKFTIETYHLPIEGGVTDRRVPEQTSGRPNSSKSSCGSTGSSPLDF